MSNCSDCPSISPIVEWSEVFLEGLGIPIVGGLGLLGNTAAILVLRLVIQLYHIHAMQLYCCSSLISEVKIKPFEINFH